MSNEKSTTQWNETRGKIKSKFGKLSDKQLDGLNGHMDKLPGMIQQAYSYDHSKAVEEAKPFTEQSKSVR